MPDIGLLKGQLEVVMCDGVRYLCVFGGRGYGKTHFIKARIARLTTTFPFFKYVYVAHEMKLAKQTWREMMQWAEFVQFVDKKKSSARAEECPVIYLKNGSLIEFRTYARGTVGRGGNANEYCLDESQNPCYKEEDVHETIVPDLRTPSPAGGHGVLLLCGQPRGDDWRKNQYYNFGVPTFEDGSPNPLYNPNRYRGWVFPASQGYVYQTEGGAQRYADLKAEFYARGIEGRLDFEQNLECKFTANKHAAYPTDEINEICRGGRLGSAAIWEPLTFETKPRPGMPYGVIVDMGRGGQGRDPTAVVVGDVHGNVSYEEEFPEQEHLISAKNACLLAIKYNRAALVVDTTGGAKPGKSELEVDEYVADYRNQADEYKITMHAIYQEPHTKQRIAQNLGLALQKRQLTIAPECRKSIRQMKAYECVKGQSKLLKWGAPQGQHDDFVSCLQMYREALNRGWITLDRPWTGAMKGLGH
jgi:hypothetical protein